MLQASCVFIDDKLAFLAAKVKSKVSNTLKKFLSL